jgi:N-acetylglucosaminyl-diphospho-decaprenol L-rhamnosyltransferase
MTAIIVMIHVMSSAPSISFVTVTWNCAEETAGLLASIEEHMPDDVEVVVIDNNSDDGIEDVVKRFDRVTFVRSEENLGFGRGNNLGVRTASAPVSVLINPDTYLIDSSLTELCEVAGHERAIFGPRVLNVDGSPQPSASAAPGSIASSLGLLLPAKLMPKRLKESLAPWRSDVTRDVGWLTGACIIGRTDLLVELGPFDPSIHMYSEDLELGIRAGSLGVRSVFAPESGRMVHIGDASSDKRYSDAGKQLSVENRFYSIAVNRSRAVAVADAALLTLGHGIKFCARKVLRHDAQNDLEWIRAIKKADLRGAAKRSRSGLKHADA